MKLCACNKCGNLYEDTNPQSGATVYPDVIIVSSLLWLPDDEDDPDIQIITGYVRCPECQTDAYLSNDIQNHIEKNKEVLQEAIQECESMEEYQEENATAWSQLQSLKMLIGE